MTAWLSAWLSGPLSVTLHVIGRESALRLCGKKAIRGRKYFQIEGGAVSGAVTSLICALFILPMANAAGWRILLLLFIVAVGVGAIVGCLAYCEKLHHDVSEEREGQ